MIYGLEKKTGIKRLWPSRGTILTFKQKYWGKQRRTSGQLVFWLKMELSGSRICPQCHSQRTPSLASDSFLSTFPYALLFSKLQQSSMAEPDSKHPSFAGLLVLSFSQFVTPVRPQIFLTFKRCYIHIYIGAANNRNILFFQSS